MDWAPELNKAAFNAGIVLAQLAPQLPNLEETFFEMTGDKYCYMLFQQSFENFVALHCF
jgi:hypothetical protein